MRRLLSTCCFHCGRDCRAPFMPPDAEDNSYPNPVLSGGGLIEMSFGYGSRYDTDRVVAVVCDDCALALVATKLPWGYAGMMDADNCGWPNVADLPSTPEDLP